MWEASIGRGAVGPEPFVSWDWWLRWPQAGGPKEKLEELV